MKASLKAVVGTLVLMLWTSSARAATPATPIATCGTTITAPGAYVLVNNLSPVSGDCIDIQVSKVRLSLNGFSIVCSSSGACGTGINVAPGSASSSGTLEKVDIAGPGNISGVRHRGHLAPGDQFECRRRERDR